MEPETMPVDLFWSNQRGILVTPYEMHKKSQSNHCTKRKSFDSSNVQCNLPAGRCLQQQDLFHRGEEANMISTATRKYATMCTLAWFFIAQKFDGSSFNTRWSPIIPSKYIVHNVRHVKIMPEVKQKITIQAPPIGKLSDLISCPSQIILVHTVNQSPKLFHYDIAQVIKTLWLQVQGTIWE
jgi:hypothetical protein